MQNSRPHYYKETLIYAHTGISNLKTNFTFEQIVITIAN